MSLYKVGEIAIIASSVWPEFPAGSEVTILEVIEKPLQWGMQYLIGHFENGVPLYAADPYLRKKPPGARSGEPLGRWDECPWRPQHKTTADAMMARIERGLEAAMRGVIAPLRQVDP